MASAAWGWGDGPAAAADAACPPGPSIAISSLSISQTMCATGSEDGYLRLWPLDFSSVFLETGGAKIAPCHCGWAILGLDGSHGLLAAEFLSLGIHHC